MRRARHLLATAPQYCCNNEYIGSRYSFRRNAKMLDYHRLITTVMPPELTMEDRELNKNARFLQGESEAGPTRGRQVSQALSPCSTDKKSAPPN
jgi:hypothetical protein